VNSRKGLILAVLLCTAFATHAAGGLIDASPDDIRAVLGRPVAQPQAVQPAAPAQFVPPSQYQANVPPAGYAPQPAQYQPTLPQPSAQPIAQPAPQRVEPTSYQVRTDDRTLRQALVRWARTAGWTFEPEHWAVGRDIPITAADTFNGSFKEAVMWATSSTEMSDLPVRPCFYSNKVLRVVAQGERCDKSTD
jgi:hypothetical protein